MKSQMQQSTTLLVKEAEYVSGTECVQDMLIYYESIQINWFESDETNDIGNQQQRHDRLIK